ncbi:unnamed protein product [Ophioblennius macclurei]
MERIIALLALSTLPRLVTPEDVSLRAVIEVVPQTSKIFTGEGIRLTCSVPDDQSSVWGYQWFRDSEQLPQTFETFSLWNAKMKESGNFSCRGVRDVRFEKLYTLKSLPVEIRVDGGLAILQADPQPGLVGGNMSMTCRVRRNPPVHEIILYKDGYEVMRESGQDAQFHLTNLKPGDRGMYSCRASWDVKRRTISVISAATYVQISEPKATELSPRQLNNQRPTQTSVPQPTVSAAAEPVTIQPSASAPPYFQYTQEAGEGSGKFPEGSGDFSEESGDFSGWSDDQTRGFDDMP